MNVSKRADLLKPRKSCELRSSESFRDCDYGDDDDGEGHLIARDRVKFERDFND